MTMCKVNHLIFDRDKVIHWQAKREVRDDGVEFYFPSAFFPGGSCGYWKTLWEGMDEDSALELINDVVTGKYDIPGQSNFLQLPISNGWETDYLNGDHIMHINYNPGGISLKMLNGDTYHINCDPNAGPIAVDERKLSKLLERHLGLRSIPTSEWEHIKSDNKVAGDTDPDEKHPMEDIPVLELRPTSLTWNTKIVYEEVAENGVLKFWVVPDTTARKAYRLLLNGKQITSQTIGGLVDMCSEVSEYSFEGAVNISSSPKHK